MAAGLLGGINDTAGHWIAGELSAAAKRRTAALKAGVDRCQGESVLHTERRREKTATVRWFPTQKAEGQRLNVTIPESQPHW